MEVLWRYGCCCLLLACLTGGGFAANSTSWTFTGDNYFVFEPEYSNHQNQHLQFAFRTTESNGLLFYHHLSTYEKRRFPSLTTYSLSGEVRLGYVRVRLLFNQYSDDISTGFALNDDKWHTLEVAIDSGPGHLVVTLDDQKTIKSLDSFTRGNAGGVLRWSELVSVITFGGRDSIQEDSFYNYIGCLRDVEYARADGVMVAVPIHDDSTMVPGCSDMCEVNNECEHYGTCINRYTDIKCDCFGTDFEGGRCEEQGPTVMTLHGYEWLTYDLYDRKIPHIVSDKTRISLEFKTQSASGVLVYGVGRAAQRTHVTAAIHAGKLHASVSIGFNDLEFDFGMGLDDGHWHNVTIIHKERSVTLFLDGQSLTKVSNGSDYFLSLDSKVFFGGGDNFVKTRGLEVTRSFAGCLRNVYFNDVSVLYELRQKNDRCKYRGGVKPVYKCKTVQDIPLSFPTASTMLSWDIPRQHNLSIQFKFRTIRQDAILFYVQLLSWISGKGYDFGYVEVWLKGGFPYLHFIPSQNSTFNQVLKVPATVSNSHWHSVKLTLENSRVKFTVDGISTNTTRYRKMLEHRGKLVFGYGLRPYERNDGFVGCMKEIKIHKEKLDPVSVVENTFSGLILDGCNLVDHCKDNNICEHESVCLSDWHGVHCDCPEYYVGKSCHFPVHLQSCDSYYRSGKNRSGVYVVDVDGSGPLRPIHVNCEMSRDHDGHRYGETIVKHNFKANTTIRQPGFGNHRYLLSYEGMRRHALRKLIAHSAKCTQEVRYDCYQSALVLGKRTWFQAADGEAVDYIGNQKPGYCDCDGHDLCDGKKCYCDHELPEWRQDKGENSVKSQLPLVEITVIQGAYGEGRLTLGPLKCWGNMHQPIDKMVTITQRDAFVQMHAWRRGDLNFHIKTYQSRSLVLHQTATANNSNSLKVTIASVHDMKFSFHLGGRTLEETVHTSQRLDNGEWHSISIARDSYNIRLNVDDAFHLIDLPDSFRGDIVFDGILYIGGSPDSDVPGFIGCFRSFLYNDHYRDLNDAVDASMSGINTGCMSSCWPNPCNHGGVCVEDMGTYSCVCADKWLHHGSNCEVDLNRDAVTFSGKDQSYLWYDISDRSGVLDETVILSFRTIEMNALLLYVHDDLNNFVQLELRDSLSVVITFNSYNTIVKHSVTVTDGVLNDGGWKRLVVEKFFNLTNIHIENKTNVIPFSRQLFKQYSSNPFRGQEESVYLGHPLKQPDPFIHLYVGGAPQGSSTIPSLKGCIRGLKMGNHVVQLADAAKDKNNGSDVTPACQTGCQTDTCVNGGFCMEQWKWGEYECDCSETDFAGSRCEVEPCAILSGDSVIQYKFQLGPKSAHSKTEQISLTFKTSGTDKRDSEGRLMEMVLFMVQSSKMGEYIIIKVDGDGSILLETNQGFGMYKMRASGDYTDGRFHDLHYKRELSDMFITVDGEKKAENDFPHYTLDEMDIIYVGGTTILDEHLEYTNFTGYVRRVVYSPMTNIPAREKLRPMNELYAENAAASVQGADVASCQTSTLSQLVTTAVPVTEGVDSEDHAELTMPPWSPGPVDRKTIGGPVLQTTVPPIVTTTMYIVITNLTLPVKKPGTVDKLTVAVAVSIIASLLLLAIIIAFLLCRKSKRQGDYYLKKDPDFEMKEPLKLNHYEASPMPLDHLAKLDEFSMVSATLGPRRPKVVEPVDAPGTKTSPDSFPPFPEGANNYPNVIYNCRKKRPASSISEVLEEMERRQRGQNSEEAIDNSLKRELSRNHGEGELEWDPIADRAPLTVGNMSYFNSPTLAKTPEEPENEMLPGGENLDIDKTTDSDPPNSATEYNGDSGYEAESRPENTEDDVTPISGADDDELQRKMYMYDITNLEDCSTAHLSAPLRQLLQDPVCESFL